MAIRTELRTYKGDIRLRRIEEGGDWAEITATCTANTSSPGVDVRCMRKMGHGGLHRYEYKGSIIEFPDSVAWFPHYSVENLR